MCWKGLIYDFFPAHKTSVLCEKELKANQDLKGYPIKVQKGLDCKYIPTAT